MKSMKRKQGGFIVTAELILIATILVIGMVVGMVVVRNAVTAEMNDVAEAIGGVDQSYEWYAMEQNNEGNLVRVDGSAMLDQTDNFADTQFAPSDLIVGSAAGDLLGISFVPAAIGEGLGGFGGP